MVTAEGLRHAKMMEILKEYRATIEKRIYLTIMRNDGFVYPSCLFGGVIFYKEERNDF